MEWRDQGALIGTRPHGESAAIVSVLTAAHGLHSGVVRGGGSRRMAAVLQPGAQVDVTWRARLDDQIGTMGIEPVRSRAVILDDGAALAGLNALCALILMALPEREPHPALYAASTGLMDRLAGGGDWPAAYLRWELLLLEEIGFGLDLNRCAVTGAREGLEFVSPRSGRAVSRAGAGDWADRLLPLPQALLGQGPASPAELAQGLAITGHFLTRDLGHALHGRALPAARARLVELLTRARKNVDPRL